MAQYIDKDALVAEIEKRKNMFYDMSKGCEDASSAKAGFYAQSQTLEGILSFLNSLEVKEVDLEKELVDYHNDNFSQCNDGTLLSNETGSELSWYDYERIAKHFFELALSLKNS